MQNDYSDPRWQRLRLQCMQRDQWVCVACGDDKSTLHVHHKRYCGNIWDSPIADLQTLCGSCHMSLGQHPKAGIWYARVGEIAKEMRTARTWNDEISADVVAMAIEHCPSCGHLFFDTTDDAMFCNSCGWSLGLRQHFFLHAPAKLVNKEHEKKRREEEDAERKKKQALGMLASWAKKCRRYGFSDADLWSCAFPEHAIPFGYDFDCEGSIYSAVLHQDEIAQVKAYLTSGLSFHDIAWELLGNAQDLRRRMIATGHAPEAANGR
jgi:uncharacterized Zn finger protein (UPF0148 family)